MNDHYQNGKHLKISIVIVAMDRRKFILQALDSVFRSLSANGAEAEVIVIKNFQDSEIDSRILSSGAVNVYSGKTGLGAKIAEAALMATGEFLLFLEDDDQFTSQKVARFLDTLNSFPNISFYHNSYEFVSEMDRTVKRVALSEPILLQSGRLNQKDLKIAFKAGIFHNLSSIAVRREIILKYLDIISEVTYALDHVLLLLAIETGGLLYVDSYTTTRILKHPSVSNPALDRSYINEKRKFLYETEKEYILCTKHLGNPMSKDICHDFLTEIELHLMNVTDARLRFVVTKIKDAIMLSIKRGSPIILVLLMTAAIMSIAKTKRINLYKLMGKLINAP